MCVGQPVVSSGGGFLKAPPSTVVTVSHGRAVSTTLAATPNADDGSADTKSLQHTDSQAQLIASLPSASVTIGGGASAVGGGGGGGGGAGSGVITGLTVSGGGAAAVIGGAAIGAGSNSVNFSKLLTTHSFTSVCN